MNAELKFDANEVLAEMKRLHPNSGLKINTIEDFLSGHNHDEMARKGINTPAKVADYIYTVVISGPSGYL